MSHEAEISKQEFSKKWGSDGFAPAGFNGRGYDEKSIVAQCMEPYRDKDKIGLEIGPGGCFWTKHMLARFKHVHLVDVIGKSPRRKLASQNFTWTVLEDRDYKLRHLEDKSIDYAFSFDVFCHFGIGARREYLQSLHRVMKDDGVVVIMFANWEALKRRKSLCFKGTREHDKEEMAVYRWGHDNRFEKQNDWYYDDEEMTYNLIDECGFKVVKRFFEDSRDTIVAFSKK